MMKQLVLDNMSTIDIRDGKRIRKCIVAQEELSSLIEETKELLEGDLTRRQADKAVSSIIGKAEELREKGFVLPGDRFSFVGTISGIMTNVRDTKERKGLHKFAQWVIDQDIERPGLTIDEILESDDATDFAMSLRLKPDEARRLFPLFKEASQSVDNLDAGRSTSIALCILDEDLPGLVALKKRGVAK
jgi:hypothetical protein